MKERKVVGWRDGRRMDNRWMKVVTDGRGTADGGKIDGGGMMDSRLREDG